MHLPVVGKLLGQFFQNGYALVPPARIGHGNRPQSLETPPLLVGQFTAIGLGQSSTASCSSPEASRASAGPRGSGSRPADESLAKASASGEQLVPGGPGQPVGRLRGLSETAGCCVRSHQRRRRLAQPLGRALSDADRAACSTSSAET